MMKIWVNQKVKTLATMLNVKAWIYIYKNLFEFYNKKLKVLDVCAGSGKFVEGLIARRLVEQGISLDRHLPLGSLNHEFIECDINSSNALQLNYNPDVISINNSVQLFPDSKPLINLINAYRPKYVLITKPSEKIIDILISRGYRQNTRMVPVQELLSGIGYGLKQKGSVLGVHYKLNPIKFILASLLIYLNLIDDYFFKGDCYEYFLFEIK